MSQVVIHIFVKKQMVAEFFKNVSHNMYDLQFWKYEMVAGFLENASEILTGSPIRRADESTWI